VIQPSDEDSLTAEQVRLFLTTRLAGFKIPRTIVFRNELPREDTGKIFKRKLRDEFTQAMAGKVP
jgi:long-chain acyl-CoA synthetase